MKPALRKLGTSRLDVPDGEVGKAELLRVLRPIDLSPLSKRADRLRAVELLGSFES